MQLYSLCQTDCLAIHYDSSNDWLFLDWQGELTLAHVQDACAALASCYLLRPYPRVLNSNAQLTGVSWSVAAWLVTDFLPHMSLAGVEHVAWVCSPLLRGRNMVQTVISWLPGPLLNIFDDVEGAVAWLQHTRSNHLEGFCPPQRLPATQDALALEVQALHQRIAARRP